MIAKNQFSGGELEHSYSKNAEAKCRSRGDIYHAIGSGDK
jgi:hypothetical protein